MGTYADLKRQVVIAVRRDDLEDDFADQVDVHIARAIEHYASRRFWFNRLVSQITTTADADTRALPSNCRLVERVDGQFGRLTCADLAEIPVTTSSGYPEQFTYDNGDLRFWPTPDAAYTFKIVGIRQIDAPTSDTDSNEWTNEAATLIVHRASLSLALDIAGDTGRAAEITPLLMQEESRLQSETIRREGTRRRARLVDNAGVPVMARYPL